MQDRQELGQGFDEVAAGGVLRQVASKTTGGHTGSPVFHCRSGHRRLARACVDGGIVFDRCRIVNHAANLPSDLLQKIEAWVNAAAKSEGLLLS